MTFWRNIASLAARRVDDAFCDQCPPGLPGEDPAFSTAVTALGAKLASADGRADPEEFSAFIEVFHPEPGGQRNIERLYDLARQTTLGFESYARRLAKRYRGCPQLLEDVLDGLFHIAEADGVVTAEELSYLERVSELFGLSPLTFQRLRALHLGAEPGDPYVILNVPHDAPDADVPLGATPSPKRTPIGCWPEACRRSSWKWRMLRLRPLMPLMMRSSVNVAVFSLRRPIEQFCVP
jgi:DnaJ like chaperone protein